MSSKKQTGMALAAVNIVVLIAALTLLLATGSARLDRQREREVELLFIGSQFVRAIELYAKPIDGAGIQYPNDLKDLVLDTRGGVERRHLRRVYLDPMTDKNDWGLVRNERGIVGVHSTSKAPPLRRAGFAPQQEAFRVAKGYHEWVFGTAKVESVIPAPASVNSSPLVSRSDG
jgi:type II secretory pathway pseudopilin PulG